MIDELARITSKHAIHGMVIDSPILVLHLIGLHDRGLISKFKRTQPFTAEDSDLLAELMVRFRKIVTTPQILAEVSNLLGQLPDTTRDQVFSGPFRTLIEQIAEEYVESRSVAGGESFPKFGLTDCSIERLSRGHAVLTADFKLYVYLMKQNADVINFHHYRDFFSQ
jgi:hypothetical protein